MSASTTVVDAAKEQEALGNYTARDALLEQANDIQQKALLFDGISSALYGPNANGATGYVAKAVSPQVAYQIGQYFKDNDAQNRENQNTELAGVNSPQHLLAHALLGAAVSAATGNDALTGGISASSGEVTATLLSKYIYKVDDPSELTAEQKDTISNITTLAGVAIGASTGEVTDAVNAGEMAKVAVEDNLLASKDFDTLYSLYEKAESNKGMLGFGKYKLSLADSIKLTDLVILDQVGNQLLKKYRKDQNSLSQDEMKALGDILNYYYSSGGSLQSIENMLKKTTGPSFTNTDWLFEPGIGGQHEEIFWQAATTRNINSQVEEVARYGGDAVWAAPGKMMYVARIALGSSAIASGLKKVKQGNYGEGYFEIGAGGLAFIPIKGRPIPAQIAHSALTHGSKVSTGAVATRINVANGPTRFTPLKSNGRPYDAGFNHVIEGHFNRPVANNRSIFTITPSSLKSILQDSNTVKSPVYSNGDGTFVRVVNTKRVIGTTSIKEGQKPTTYIKIFTDAHGNLLTTFPVKGN